MKKKTESSINCDTEEEIIKKTKFIIRLNSLKALTYHQNKLHDNNIFLDDIKTNQIIRHVRNMIYPKDAEFVNNIINITIIFDEHVGKATNVPFCPTHNIFINPKRNIEKKRLFY
jgi:hypothetical protein